MENEFWHDRWDNNEIGFHQQTVNAYLQKYWSQLQLEQGAQVLVPCCGKSLDLLWLNQQGFNVQGIEISQLAVDAFFSENNLAANIRVQGEYRISAIDGLQLYCGDFFQLTATDIKGVTAVYDRASMIAMPLDMRQAYCQHLQTITDKQIPILLVTLEYPDGEMQGPPFSITENEVQEIYSADYKVQVLETQDILDKEDYFRDKGLTRLQERAYLLTPHRSATGGS